MKQDAIDGACKTHGENRNAYRIFSRKLKEGDDLEGQEAWNTSEYIVKMYHNERGSEYIGYIQFSEGKAELRAFVNTIINFLIS
jgi:hypothetical protein